MFHHLGGKIGNAFSSLGSKINTAYNTIGGHIRRGNEFINHTAKRISSTAKGLTNLHPIFNTVSEGADNVSEFSEKLTDGLNKADEVKNRIEKTIRNN